MLQPTSPKDISYQVNKNMSAPQKSAQEAKLQDLVRLSLENTSDSCPVSNTKGEICVLFGTSTAGKSSIIKKLIEIEPDRKEFGLDLLELTTMRNYFKDEHPDDFAFLQAVLEPKKDGFEDMHILDATAVKKFLFKNGVSEADQQKAREIAEHLHKKLVEEVNFDNMESVMMDEVLCHSVCGKSTILDIMEVEQIFNHVHAKNLPFAVPIKTVLVYCPFKAMPERIAERNRKAKENKQYNEIKAGVFPLTQFAKYFAPKTSEDDKIIETLTRSDVEEAFDSCFNNGKEYDKELDPEQYAKKEARGEYEEEYKAGKQKLLKDLGFTDASIQMVELTPKFKNFDFIINTKDKTPDQSAEMLRRQ